MNQGKSSKTIGLLVLSLAFAIWGCGGGGGSGGNGSGGSGGGGSNVVASAEIGPEGGVVEVTDPSSDLYGIKVTIFKNTFTGKELVEIEEPGAVPQLPIDMNLNGSVVNLYCSHSGTFSKPVMVSLPVHSNVPKDGNYLGAASYNESLQQWEKIDAWHNFEDKEMVFLTNHFSPYAPAHYPIIDPSQHFDPTNFSLQSDSMEFANEVPGGLCVGVSNFTAWYYDFFGPGLRLCYNYNRAAVIAQEVHHKHKGWLEFWKELPSGLLQFFYNTSTFYMILDELLDNRLVPFSAVRRDTNLNHVYVLYDWIFELTPGLYYGYFNAYDPNNNQPVRIWVKHNHLWFLPTYSFFTFEVENHPEYNIFYYFDYARYICHQAWEKNPHDAWNVRGVLDYSGYTGEVEGELTLESDHTFNYEWTSTIIPDGEPEQVETEKGEGIWSVDGNLIRLSFNLIAIYEGEVTIGNRKMVLKGPRPDPQDVWTLVLSQEDEP